MSGSTNQNGNPYGRSGSSTFSGPNQTVNTRSGSNANGRAGAFSSSTGAKGAGYQNNITGNSGDAVKTQNGDVYAGHDGNVYQHTDNGWSKYNNGSWNPVQPPSRNTTNTPSNNNRQGATQATQSAARGNSMDRSNYQQLEQDRLGRQAGNGGWAGSRGGAGWQGARGGGGGWRRLGRRRPRRGWLAAIGARQVVATRHEPKFQALSRRRPYSRRITCGMVRPCNSIENTTTA